MSKLNYSFTSFTNWISICVSSDHGSHFFRLTNFLTFPVFLKVLLLIKVWVTYLQGFLFFRLTNFPDFSSIFLFFNFLVYFFSDFPSILGKIPDFSSLSKNSLTGIRSPVFPGFPVRVGTIPDAIIKVNMLRSLNRPSVLTRNINVVFRVQI